jgi:hypothetical protein
MSKLEGVSLPFRTCSVVRNDYNYNDEYNVGHPDALSTGDENGKGVVNEQAGGTTDIKVRECSIARNKYNNNNQYNDATA